MSQLALQICDSHVRTTDTVRNLGIVYEYYSEKFTNANRLTTPLEWSLSPVFDFGIDNLNRFSIRLFQIIDIVYMHVYIFWC